TCINRVVSTDNSDISSSEYIVKIAEKASLKVLMMDKSYDLCCGMAFSSKGYTKSGGIIQGMLIDQIKKAYRKYKVPIIIDMSPCTETIRKSMNFEQIKIMDSLDFLNTIKSRLSIKKLNLTCYVHSVCSDQPAGPTSVIHSIAQNCVEAIEDRKEDFCCGMGGDRGLKYPELTENSIKRSVHFPLKSTIGVSSSRTCEIALSKELGIEFISIEALVYRSLKN
ncbi:(Fe-S)-binding protein, partial [Candidatus Marinimicrobia bacterium]|nr:(Fe-S)-binding protein [Candidatus Neomarinimicrobiota bacterium]